MNIFNEVMKKFVKYVVTKSIQEEIPIPYELSLEFVTRNNGLRKSYQSEDLRFLNLLSHHDISSGSITHKSYIFDDIYYLPSSKDVSPDSLRSLELENAGGGSNISEMYSIDYFQQVYNAYDLLLEMEVKYQFQYKMVDYICAIDGQRIGISVARAMGYPTAEKFNIKIARHLLHKKLYGLIVARNSVIKEQTFYKSVLHIWCQNEKIMKLLKQAYSELDHNDYGLDIKGFLILQLTVCDDLQLYKNFLKR